MTCESIADSSDITDITDSSDQSRNSMPPRKKIPSEFSPVFCLPAEMLANVLSWVTDPHDMHSVMLTCSSWNAVGSEVFDRRPIGLRSFLHAVHIDQKRLPALVARSKTCSQSSMETIVSWVRDPKVLEGTLSAVNPKFAMTLDWYGCLTGAVLNDNVPAVRQLFESRVQFEAQTKHVLTPANIEALVLASKTKCMTRSLLDGLLTDPIVVTMGPVGLVTSMCHHGKTEVIAELLRSAFFCTPHVIQLVLRHAIANNVRELAEALVAYDGGCPALREAMCVVMNRRHVDAVVFYLRETTRRGWENVVDGLLAAIRRVPKNANNRGVDDENTSDGEEGPETTRALQIALRYAVITGKLSTVRAIHRRAQPPSTTTAKGLKKRRRSMVSDENELNVGANNNLVVREAMEMGHEEIALFLLEDTSVSIRNSTAAENSLICCAIRNGQTGKVLDTILDMAALLPGIVNQYNGAAMKLATEMKDATAAAKLLNMPDLAMKSPDVLAVFRKLQGHVADRVLSDKRFRRQINSADWTM